jgi:hypothetical protein
MGSFPYRVSRHRQRWEEESHGHWSRIKANRLLRPKFSSHLTNALATKVLKGTTAAVRPLFGGERDYTSDHHPMGSGKEASKASNCFSFCSRTILHRSSSNTKCSSSSSKSHTEWNGIIGQIAVRSSMQSPEAAMAAAGTS